MTKLFLLSRGIFKMPTTDFIKQAEADLIAKYKTKDIDEVLSIQKKILGGKMSV